MTDKTRERFEEWVTGKRQWLGSSRPIVRAAYEYGIKCATADCQALVRELVDDLTDIETEHDGNQSPAMNMPDLDYARLIIRRIHRKAKTTKAKLIEWLEGK